MKKFGNFKKFLAFTVALLMSFAVPTTAIAVPRDISVPTSYNFTLELTIGLDMYDSEAGSSLIPSLFGNLRMDVTGSMISKYDGLYTQTFMEGGMYIGEILRLPIASWTTMDFRDLENPIWTSITRESEIGMGFPLPDELLELLGESEETENHYLIADFSPFLADLFELLLVDVDLDEVMADMADIDEETIEALIDMSRAAFPFNQVARNSYRLVMNDSQLTEAIIYYFTSLFEIDLEVGLEEYDPELYAILEVLYDFMRQVNFITDTMEINRRFNNAGYEVYTSMETSFILDLRQWASALEAIDPEEFEGLYDEMPNATITVDFGFTITYENINNATLVPVPVTTPENSTNILDEFFEEFLDEIFDLIPATPRLPFTYVSDNSEVL
jgi:hypothetical protein